MDSQLIPHVQLRNNAFVGYSLSTRKSSSLKRIANMKQVRAGFTTQDGIINPKAYSGIVTQGMQKRIKAAVDILIQTSKIKYKRSWTKEYLHPTKLVFVTLTVPDNTLSGNVEKEAGICLAKFLRWMRLKQNMNSYIWKVERQARGSLHYHITTNVFVSHVQIRQQWNKLIDMHRLMEDFKSKHGHSNPNSTDVHAVYKCKDVAAYLAKYLSKADQNEVPVKGKVWDCSLNLKSSKRFDFLEDLQFKRNIEDLIDQKKVEVILSDRFYMIKGDLHILLSALNLDKLRKYDNWIERINCFDRIVNRQLKHHTLRDSKASPHRPIGTPSVGKPVLPTRTGGQSAQGQYSQQLAFKLPQRTVLN